MNCETCKERKPQEPVPYRVHTEDMACPADATTGAALLSSLAAPTMTARRKRLSA